MPVTAWLQILLALPGLVAFALRLKNIIEGAFGERWDEKLREVMTGIKNAKTEEETQNAVKKLHDYIDNAFR